MHVLTKFEVLAVAGSTSDTNVVISDPGLSDLAYVEWLRTHQLQLVVEPVQHLPVSHSPLP